MGIKWLEEEVNIIIDNKGNTMGEYIKLLKDRTPNAIQKKCSEYNIKIPYQSKVWSKEDTLLLELSCNNINTMRDIYEILPHINPLSIKSKCAQLNLSDKIVHVIRKWEQWELDYLKCNYYKTKLDDVVVVLNRAKSVISIKVTELGLNKIIIQKWTEDEINYLKNNCDLSIDELQKFLNYRSEISIRNELTKLGIKVYYKGKILTSKEEDLFAENYPIKSMTELLVLFPKLDKKQVKNFAIKRKLRKIKSDTKVCKNCLDTLPNTNEFFGGQTTCRKCANLLKSIKLYRDKYNIIINDSLEEINPVQWYEYLFNTPNNNQLTKLPQYIYENENLLIDIWKYALKNKLGIKTRNDVINITQESLLELKIMFRKERCGDKYMLYEIISKSYPEYNIKECEMSDFIGCDNLTALNSNEEKTVFDFIYDVLKIKSIKGIGLNRKQKYRYILPKDSMDFAYIPDFVIEEVNGKVLDKPVIIEYYGMYNIENKHPIYTKYVAKTHRKNKFYKSKQDIYFIELYPEDLLNSCSGVRRKLTSFFMQNFNINITKGGVANGEYK